MRFLHALCAVAERRCCVLEQSEGQGTVSYAFGFTLPREMLEKARREVGRLEAAEERGAPVEELQDVAINAALTLWHISDWIARSADQRCVAAVERIKRERPSRKTSSIEIIRERILDDSHMALCEALANGAKHLTLHEPPRFDPARVLHGVATVRRWPTNGTAAVALEADVTAQPSVPAALPRYFAKLRIDGEGVPALDAFKRALAYWDRFFETYKL